jgi:hypothetical protein
MRKRIRWVFLVPLVAVIWTPFYAEGGPALGPFPFVIWYQFAMVVLGSLLTATVYRVEREHSPASAARPRSGVPPADLPRPSVTQGGASDRDNQCFRARGIRGAVRGDRSHRHARFPLAAR